MSLKVILFIGLLGFSSITFCQTKTVTIKSNKDKKTNEIHDYPQPPPPPGSKNIQISSTTNKDLGYLVPEIKKLKAGIEIYKPKLFYFSKVIDESNSDSIGFALLQKSFSKKKILSYKDKGPMLTEYLKRITSTDTSLFPVIIRLKKIQISESGFNQGYVNGNIETYGAVYCEVGDKWIFLDSLKDERVMELYIGGIREYDKALSTIFSLIPEYIDGLLKYSLKNNEVFIKGVHVKAAVTERPVDEENDTLFISNNLYINWSDYRGEVISPKGINSVLYIDISTSDTLINGYLESNFSFTPFFLRKKSWIGNEIRSNELLEFEQYRSRLVYLYALKMKASVLGKTYDLNSFKDSVSKIYSLLNDELSVALQRYGYDTQTGKDKKKQIAWEEKIDGWIEEYRKL